MIFDRYHRRKLFSHGMTVLTGLAIVIIIVPLIAVIYEAVLLGAPAFSIMFFTTRPALPCTSVNGSLCALGGISIPLDGTFLLLGIASLVALPIGIGAAIFTVEYGGQRWIARVISSTADVLSGVPSILAGVFVYAVFLQYDRTLAFSTLSGSLALAALMIPIVVRTSEVALRTVPNSVREAALALGIPRWKIGTRIVLVTALPGVVTGALLSVARAAGEAAPLLFTLGDACFHPLQGLTYEGCAMPLWIFIGATSPYQNWISLAWGAALFLIILILAISLISRFVLDRMVRRMSGV
ncbi:MAG: phosphate ABC transporter permease PstA [Thermoplasmata archaeon]